MLKDKLTTEEFELVLTAAGGDDDAWNLIEETGVFDKLYEYYLNAGEMPYGVAKARDGDPYEWVFCRIEQDYS